MVPVAVACGRLEFSDKSGGAVCKSDPCAIKGGVRKTKTDGGIDSETALLVGCATTSVGVCDF